MSVPSLVISDSPGPSLRPGCPRFPSSSVCLRAGLLVMAECHPSQGLPSPPFGPGRPGRALV